MKSFVVGETYLTTDKEPWKVLLRAESLGYVEIVVVDKNDERHALEVFRCVKRFWSFTYGFDTFRIG